MPSNSIPTTLVCKLWQVTDLNLEEGGAFTVSSAEEILSGGPVRLLLVYSSCRYACSRAFASVLT